MERKLTLDLCGLDVDLILTDDKKLLGGEDKAGNDEDTEERLSFGKYSVDKCRIWLNVCLAPSAMQNELFHEIHEFLLAHYNMFTSLEDNHFAFMRFSNVLWSACKRNQETLFGNKLAELLRTAHIDERQRMAKEAEQEG